MFWLAMLSILGALLGLLIDESVYELTKVRMDYRDNYWIWVSSCLVAVSVAVAMVRYVSKEAEGSGIP